MPRPRHPNSFRAVVLLSMVTVLSSACTSWYPISPESPGFPSMVRVTTESDRVMLRDARRVADTAIAGLGKGRIPRSIRLDDIRGLEGGQVNSRRVVLFAVGIPVLVLFAIVANGLKDSN